MSMWIDSDSKTRPGQSVELDYKKHSPINNWVDTAQPTFPFWPNGPNHSV